MKLFFISIFSLHSNSNFLVTSSSCSLSSFMSISYLLRDILKCSNLTFASSSFESLTLIYNSNLRISVYEFFCKLVINEFKY